MLCAHEMIYEWSHIAKFSDYLVKTELCVVQLATGYKFMLNIEVHKKFINEFVFINHFESLQIYEHFSQHGNTAFD